MEPIITLRASCSSLCFTQCTVYSNAILAHTSVSHTLLVVKLVARVAPDADRRKIGSTLVARHRSTIWTLACLVANAEALMKEQIIIATGANFFVMRVAIDANRLYTMAAMAHIDLAFECLWIHMETLSARRAPLFIVVWAILGIDRGSVSTCTLLRQALLGVVVHRIARVAVTTHCGMVLRALRTSSCEAHGASACVLDAFFRGYIVVSALKAGHAMHLVVHGANIPDSRHPTVAAALVLLATVTAG